MSIQDALHVFCLYGSLLWRTAKMASQDVLRFLCLNDGLIWRRARCCRSRDNVRIYLIISELQRVRRIWASAWQMWVIGNPNQKLKLAELEWLEEQVWDRLEQEIREEKIAIGYNLGQSSRHIPTTCACGNTIIQFENHHPSQLTHGLDSTVLVRNNSSPVSATPQSLDWNKIQKTFFKVPEQNSTGLFFLPSLRILSCLVFAKWQPFTPEVFC